MIPGMKLKSLDVYMVHFEGRCYWIDNNLCINKLVQIYISCCSFLYLCIFKIAILIYCIFLFNFIDENIRVHGNEHQVKCGKGKITGKPGSP